ncbi:MAG: LysR family transcriptional regulator [Gammaproteobacteria bacterium]|nr:LysR family transcriptional regulator [Gammaproteobacteria bacterium]
MNETNFDWDDLRLFLAVARHGGLAAAEADTGKSAPTLSRRMLALERQLGQELFQRLPRGYVLTAEGTELLKRVSTIENTIEPIVTSSGDSIQRRVKISAGTWTTHFLCKQVTSLVSDPSIILQFISAEHALDIPHREAVIGIRNERPTQIGLAGRQLGKVQFAAYAAHEQLSTWVGVQGSTPSALWVKENYFQATCIEVTQPRNALDIVLAGVANAVLPTFIGDKTDGLIKLSEDIEVLEHTQWLVSHHEDRHLPEVRDILDRLHSLFLQ